MKIFRLFAVGWFSIAAAVACAESTEAATAPGTERENPCRLAPEKCKPGEAPDRMRQSMIEGCKKNPDGCMERREQAAKRRAAAVRQAPEATPGQ